MKCPYYQNCGRAVTHICNESNEDNFCQRKFRLDYLFNEALITDKQRVPISLYHDEPDDKAFDDLDKARKNIENYVASGTSLYLYSSITGNGKTSWAIRLISAYFYSIWHKTDLRCRGLFINVPKFLLCLKENISQKSDYIAHIKENVLDADIVIWDDIGSKAGTEFEIENMLSIINNRIDEGKTNIYTSNLNPEQLEKALGPRLASRVAGMSWKVELKENDKRDLANNTNTSERG